jgi:hypothetical protein
MVCIICWKGRGLGDDGEYKTFMWKKMAEIGQPYFVISINWFDYQKFENNWIQPM